MKLGLGSAQFGMDYGISNTDGKKTSVDEVSKILDVAGQYGVRIIDTAFMYGVSEEVLGKALPENHGFQIVTKTPSFVSMHTSSDKLGLLERTFYNSLQKMRLPAAYGLLIHHADDLLGEDGFLLFEKMTELKRKGLVKKIGVSVYNGQQIERIVDRFRIDLIQFPINVLDQRLLLGGYLSRLKAAGIEVHARSVFLQGLLLMKIEDLPPHFRPITEHLTAYHAAMERRGISPVAAALGFVAGIDEIDSIICGINNHQQLNQIYSVLKPLDTKLFAEFAIDDEMMINPAKWRI